MRFIPRVLIVKGLLATLRQAEYGSVRLTTPKGVTLTITGKQPGPDAQFILHDWDVIEHIVARGDIALGEDYVDGKWNQRMSKH